MVARDAAPDNQRRGGCGEPFRGSFEHARNYRTGAPQILAAGVRFSSEGPKRPRKAPRPTWGAGAGEQRGVRRPALLDAQRFLQRRHVALGLDLVLRQLHLALGVQHHRGADDALRDLALDQLLAPGAVGQCDSVVLVGQEREGQGEVAGEVGQGFGGVGGCLLYTSPSPRDS